MLFKNWEKLIYLNRDSHVTFLVVSIMAPSVLFEPDELVNLSCGISINEPLFTIKPGKSSRGKIEVLDNAEHDILLLCHSVLG